MAIRTRVMPGRGLIVSQALGVFTLDDLQAHRARVMAHPQYVGTMGLLMDLRRVTRFDIATGGIRAQASTLDSSRYSRIAVVVRDDVAYGLARMFQAFTGDRYGDEGLRTFREPMEAWRWIQAGV